MQQNQFINIIHQPHLTELSQLSELEALINEYPFFETAHLLYTKALFQNNALNYNKQLRKTAIVANSRSVLYNLLHQPIAISTSTQEVINTVAESEKIEKVEVVEVKKEISEPITEQKPISVSPITITNNDIKVIYVNTVPSETKLEVKSVDVVAENIAVKKQEQDSQEELDIVKAIENDTDAFIVEPTQEEKLNKEIELEISKGIVQSYIETDVLKTPELTKEEKKEPETFTDWLNRIKKESGTIQVEVKKEPIKEEKVENTPQIEKKITDFDQKKQIIDRIIDADPGRIKLGNTKFFTPSAEAKQSLLENEHLVTETLAKIYALQGNISKAIRAYEILSLKFPQKSVYFATLIEKLKTSK